MDKISRNLKDQNYTIGKSGKKVFAKGNVIGRMPKKGYTLNDLTNMAIQYEKTNDVSILKHYIEQLKKDNRLLENFVNRYVPLKQEIDIKVPDTIRVKTFIQAGAKPVIKDEEPEEVEEKEIRGEDVHKEIPKEIETIL